MHKPPRTFADSYRACFARSLAFFARRRSDDFAYAKRKYVLQDIIRDKIRTYDEQMHRSFALSRPEETPEDGIFDLFSGKDTEGNLHRSILICTFNPIDWSSETH